LAARRADGPRVPAVVMAHAFVVGGAASESERDIRVGGVDSVPLEVLTGDHGPAATPDYVALGHLHGPQRVGPAHDPGRPGPLARYSGSPLAYSLSATHHTQSRVLLDPGPAGRERIDLAPPPSPRRPAEATATPAAPHPPPRH